MKIDLKLFIEGKFDASKMVALTGSEILKPKYYKTHIGASIEGMIEDNVTDKADAETNPPSFLLIKSVMQKQMSALLAASLIWKF